MARRGVRAIMGVCICPFKGLAGTRTRAAGTSYDNAALRILRAPSSTGSVARGKSPSRLYFRDKGYHPW